VSTLFGYSQQTMRACPSCRGYGLESQWCDHCKRAGIVLVPAEVARNCSTFRAADALIAELSKPEAAK
jgi:hypothetical protein